MGVTIGIVGAAEGERLNLDFTHLDYGDFLGALAAAAAPGDEALCRLLGCEATDEISPADCARLAPWLMCLAGRLADEGFRVKAVRLAGGMEMAARAGKPLYIGL
jgi:hypothetical protein